MYNFIIPTRPVPAARMTQKGKFVRPEALRYLEYKERVGWTAKAAGVKPLGGAVSVECVFYLEKRGRTPDLDNLVKSVLDGLNGIAWEDDKQVVKISAERRMQGPERAEVRSFLDGRGYHYKYWIDKA